MNLERGKVTDYHYPFQWMDELLEITLNPHSSPCYRLSDEQLEYFDSEVSVQLTKIFSMLKSATFDCRNTDDVRLTINQYLNAIEELIEQAIINQDAYSNGSPLQTLGRRVCDRLKEFKLRLQKRYQSFLPQYGFIHQTSKKQLEPALFKIICKLSSDQIGLILKAADEAQLLMSRSMSLVFKAIIPFLSTPRKQNLSWNSIRISTYRPEQADKQAAIEALKNLISKIEGYR
jgi:hypothetical protein